MVFLIMMYPKLTVFAKKNCVNLIEFLNPDLIREIQLCLKRLELYSGEIDGLYGQKTKDAYEKFKLERHLDSPELIGSSTALSLIESSHDVIEEQIGSDSNLELNPELGKSTGNTMNLPTGELVYANQFVIPGRTPNLTWGEVTKNCTRVPQTNRNLLAIDKIALIFQEIRDKYGEPIAVTSGYRPLDVNKAVGGARYSRHIEGDALDITGSNLIRLLEIVRSIDGVTGLGLGMHRGFIHIDARKSPRVVFNYG